MSVSTWVFATFDNNAKWDELWRFTSDITNDSSMGHRMLAAFQLNNVIKISHGVGSNYNFECTVSGLPTITNEWIHIGASISQTTGDFICCVKKWGSSNASTCTVQKFEGNISTFTTAHKLVISGRADADAT